jgi:hypothetical protein
MAGSVGLDNGLWLLPYSKSAEKFIKEMKRFVSGQGGTSRTFLSNAFDEETEKGILKQFVRDREEEYAELKEKCADFLDELVKETRARNFSFAEFEENDHDLRKLETWFDKVKQRDFMGGTQEKSAAEWLEKCRGAMQRFAADVYAHEDKDHARIIGFDPGRVTRRVKKEKKHEQQR